MTEDRGPHLRLAQGPQELNPALDGAERSAERGVAERERSGERRLVTGLGWSVERLFRPLRSAHMLCVEATKSRFYNLCNNTILYSGSQRLDQGRRQRGRAGGMLTQCPIVD